MGARRLGENNTRITDDATYIRNYMKAYYQKNLCKAVVQVNCNNCGRECTVQRLNNIKKQNYARGGGTYLPES